MKKVVAGSTVALLMLSGYLSSCASAPEEDSNSKPQPSAPSVERNADDENSNNTHKNNSGESEHDEFGRKKNSESETDSLGADANTADTTVNGKSGPETDALGADANTADTTANGKSSPETDALSQTNDSEKKDDVKDDSASETAGAGSKDGSPVANSNEAPNDEDHFEETMKRLRGEGEKGKDTTDKDSVASNTRSDSVTPKTNDMEGGTGDKNPALDDKDSNNKNMPNTAANIPLAKDDENSKTGGGRTDSVSSDANASGKNGSGTNGNANANGKNGSGTNGNANANGKNGSGTNGNANANGKNGSGTNGNANANGKNGSGTNGNANANGKNGSGTNGNANANGKNGSGTNGNATADGKNGSGANGKNGGDRIAQVSGADADKNANAKDNKNGNDKNGGNANSGDKSGSNAGGARISQNSNDKEDVKEAAVKDNVERFSKWYSPTLSQIQNCGYFYTTPEICKFDMIEGEFKKTSGYNKSAYGFVFGYSTPDARGYLKDYIRFEINVDGEYALYTWDGKTYTDLVEKNNKGTAYFYKSDAIKKGYNTLNTIKIQQDKNTYSVYVNGKLIQSGIQPLKKGTKGVMAFFSVGKTTQEKLPQVPVNVAMRISDVKRGR